MTRIAIIAIAAVALALSALFTWALAKQGWSAAETNWRLWVDGEACGV